MRMASSQARTWSASASASENTATVAIPSRRAVRAMRQAISPRLAISRRRGNVTVVTVNHRLNAFGHLYLAEIAGAEFADSGNVGILDLILALGHKKGDVLGIARVAGIMAAKKTADLIPLCHAIALTHVDIELTPEPAAGAVYCRACVACARTSVRARRVSSVKAMRASRPSSSLALVALIRS